MLVELSRLVLGLAILAFHRHIADFLQLRERRLVILFRQRGVPAPYLTTEMARNLYFALGLFVCTVQIWKLWTMLPGR